MNPFDALDHQPEPDTSVQLSRHTENNFTTEASAQTVPAASRSPDANAQPSDLNGFPAPLNQPLYPSGSPLGPARPTIYPPGVLPGQTPPPSFRRRRRVGWIIFSLALAVAVLGSGVAATVFYVANSGLLPGSLGTRSVLAPTPTPELPVVLADPLTSNVNGWSNDPQRCFFQGTGYHVVNGGSCFAPTAALGIETVSVQASVLTSGSAYYSGVQFWQQPTLSLNCYAFLLDTHGGWVFFKTINDQDTELARATNSAIHAGTGSSNTLEVRATAGHIELFVNNTPVGHINDVTFTHGFTALYGDPGGEVVFHTLRITGQAAASPVPPPGSVLTHDQLTFDLGNLPADPGFFQQDGYHMTGSSIATYGYHDDTDVNIEVTERHIAGDLGDAFGIAFRHASAGNSYVFVMAPGGDLGFYALVNAHFTLIASFKPGVITRTGIGAINTLEVRATGSQFEFYVNNVNVGSAHDSTFPSGLSGLVSSGGETVFTDLFVTSGG